MVLGALNSQKTGQRIDVADLLESDISRCKLGRPLGSAVFLLSLAHRTVYWTHEPGEEFENIELDTVLRFRRTDGQG